jgi:putative DNA primase/helicase
MTIEDRQPPEDRHPASGGLPATVELIRADTIKPERVSWLWPGWLAAGKLHLLIGQPGDGKSTLALGLAAAITMGAPWPDGTRAERGNVIVWSGEDSAKDTILPRFLAAGGDSCQLHIVGQVRDGREVRPFDPKTDMPKLIEAARTLPRVALVIVDPMVLVVAGDTNKANDVRRGLQALADLADALECAVLGIGHLNKNSQGRNPLDRICGSGAYGAAPRVILMTARADDDPTRRLLARAKSNIGPDGGGFAFALKATPVPGFEPLESQYVEFIGSLEGSARDLLQRFEGMPGGQESAASVAADFLTEMLDAGPITVPALRADAKSRGVSWRTIERAKSTLGVISEKSGMHGGWEWRLPK